MPYSVRSLFFLRLSCLRFNLFNLLLRGCQSTRYINLCWVYISVSLNKIHCELSTSYVLLVAPITVLGQDKNFVIEYLPYTFDKIASQNHQDDSKAQKHVDSFTNRNKFWHYSFSHTQCWHCVWAGCLKSWSFRVVVNQPALGTRNRICAISCSCCHWCHQWTVLWAV